MKIRKGDKILVRLTAAESVPSSARITSWFSALDRDGDEITVCVGDVVAVERTPLPEEPPMYSLVQTSDYKIFRRWPVGWGRIGTRSDSEEELTWEQLNVLCENDLQVMVPREETE